MHPVRPDTRDVAEAKPVFGDVTALYWACPHRYQVCAMWREYTSPLGRHKYLLYLNMWRSQTESTFLQQQLGIVRSRE